MSLGGQYGTSKIGTSRLVAVSASTWSEIVLQALAGTGALLKPSSFVITTDDVVYLAQANHLHTIAGVTYTFPVDPAATPGVGPGYFELQANVPWRIDDERPGENSLWVWCAANVNVRVTELLGTTFDDG